MLDAKLIGTYFITITLMDEIGTKSDKYYYSIVLLDKTDTIETTADEA